MIVSQAGCECMSDSRVTGCWNCDCCEGWDSLCVIDFSLYLHGLYQCVTSFVSEMSSLLLGGFIGYTSLAKKGVQARFEVRGIFGSEWLVFTPGVQDVSILISVFSGEPYFQF
jgi:hypothetical protein